MPPRASRHSPFPRKSNLVERWDKLDKLEADGGLGDDGDQAKKVLGERGLTTAKIDEAKALLDKLRQVAGPLPDLDAAAAEEVNFEKAEEELWGWYLEWSAIARKAVTQRSLLLKLGFLRSHSSGKDEVVDDKPEEEEKEEEKG